MSKKAQIPKKPADTKCNGITKDGKRYCGKPAGWGTDHKGTGRCRTHGGHLQSLMMKHGLYSRYSRSSLSKKIEELATSDNQLMDLSQELNLSRAVLMDYMERMKDIAEKEDFFPDSQTEQEFINGIAKIVNLIVKVVDTIHKMSQSGTITMVVFRRLMQQMALGMIKHIQPCKKCQHDETEKVINAIEKEWMSLQVDPITAASQPTKDVFPKREEKETVH